MIMIIMHVHVDIQFLQFHTHADILLQLSITTVVIIISQEFTSMDCMLLALDGTERQSCWVNHSQNY